jgi:hypothetical protein
MRREVPRIARAVNTLKEVPAMRAARSVLVVVGSMVFTACATTGASEAPLSADTRAIAYDESRSVSENAGESAIGAAASVACDAIESPPAARCPQCPQEPARVAVDRGFTAQERQVGRCLATRRAGTLRVRAEFSSVGAPLRIELAGARLGESEARCLREALCSVRVPTFQRPSAFVRYEYEGLQSLAR